MADRTDRTLGATLPTPICIKSRPTYSARPMTEIQPGQRIVRQWTVGRGGALGVAITDLVTTPAQRDGKGWALRCHSDVYYDRHPIALPVLDVPSDEQMGGRP